MDEQGFGRAASVHFLQGHTEIVLQRVTKSPVLTSGSAEISTMIERSITDESGGQAENTRAVIAIERKSHAIIKYSTRGSFIPKI